MPDSPKLAVVISCYNYESFVERAIQSVLSQARDDCEVVVVDDGSTDGSWDVISRSGVTAFRIENSGARLACLFGFDKTRAPFVLFLDADDELKPGALGMIIDRLDPGVAKLQFPLTRIDADGNVISAALPALEAFRDRDALALQVLKNGVYKSPPTSGNVFRRDLCELLREADYDKFVDGVILFAAPFLGDVVSVSEELGRYRIHGRNDSGLGRMPDAGSLERDINRFLARMEHLRTILRRLEPDQELVDPRDTFYFREQRFCADLASGQRPPLTALQGLLSKLLGASLSVKNKTAMAVFFVLASVLPNDVGKALLAYRFKTGRRSALGFAKEIFARRVPLQN
jgi:glycosyltransferase involved in cell wall biosynthesis